MSACLLDINLLIALAWPDHVHHALAHRWFARSGKNAWATCPLTQLGFVRISSNPRIVSAAVSPREATQVLAGITARMGHEFWPDPIEVTAVPEFSSTAFVGHRQVTDAYLIGLARHRKGRLATLDRGLTDLVADPEERRRLIEVIPT